MHGVALDLHDVEDVLAAVVAAAFELAADLDPGRELRARDGAHQAFVAQAEGVLRLQRQHGLEAGSWPSSASSILGRVLP
jgi:hypothetical protein